MYSTLKIIDGYPVLRNLSFENEEFFTEENEHNPMVIPNCPKCIMGKTAGMSNTSNKSQGHILCESCGGSGILTPPVAKLMFENNKPPLKVSCKVSGFLHCPKCGTGFKYYDKRVWSGKRHACGQKLEIDTMAHKNA